MYKRVSEFVNKINERYELVDNREPHSSREQSVHDILPRLARASLLRTATSGAVASLVPIVVVVVMIVCVVIVVQVVVDVIIVVVVAVIVIALPLVVVVMTLATIRENH